MRSVNPPAIAGAWRLLYKEAPFQYISDSVMFKAEEYVNKFDLAKEITPAISGNLFNYYLEGSDISVYMQIDTYSMKIFIYDAMECEVINYVQNERVM